MRLIKFFYLNELTATKAFLQGDFSCFSKVLVICNSLISFFLIFLIRPPRPPKLLLCTGDQNIYFYFSHNFYIVLVKIFESFKLLK